MINSFLQGVRVLAVTQVWAGPWMGGILADMGAEVIKIESNQKLDFMRRRPEGVNRGPNFNAYNRGVKSCTLDLKQPAGVEIFKKLVQISDAIITNFAPRVMPDLGLGYSELKAVKPDIIMVSLPGFGSTGPDKDYVSYASTIEATGGLSASFGYPGDEPVLSGVWPADPTGGLYGALCVCNAIYFHHQTGKGQHVEIAQNQAITTLIPEVTIEYVMNDRIRPRMGNRDEIMAPHGCYPCKGEDKWVAIAVSNDNEWKALCRVMGDPYWIKEERFSDQFSRWQNQDELNKLIAGWTKDFTPGELFNDPHVKERGAFIELSHPEVGKTIVCRSPWTSALTAVNPAAPCIGQHNSYVFKDLLGLSDTAISELNKEKVIF
jgi:benzylsuccinate CoA-transferase BbsF subunit